MPTGIKMRFESSMVVGNNRSEVDAETLYGVAAQPRKE